MTVLSLWNRKYIIFIEYQGCTGQLESIVENQPTQQKRVVQKSRT